MFGLCHLAEILTAEWLVNPSFYTPSGRFMKENGIKHARTLPYHPASNGEAERFIQTFKQFLKASKNDSGSLSTKLSRFLITYRNTPSSTTGVSPAELFMKHQLRTRLDLLHPLIQKRVQESKQIRSVTMMLIVNTASLILDNLFWWETLEMVQSGYLVP